jgi:hypothetical protein
MVQVGCTNNYGRRSLCKEIGESENKQIIDHKKHEVTRRRTSLRILLRGYEFPRVDYPGNVGENDSALLLDPRFVGASAILPNRGPVAQLGARFHGMEEVVGSIPTRSTIFSSTYRHPALQFRVAWPSSILTTLRFGAKLRYRS